jgi:putative membrane-bound dehydrogenase-like protein
MKRAAWFLVVLGAWIGGLPSSRGADAQPAASLKVPDGFSIELVASAPLVGHPVMAGFDDRGRLFVADNAGLNLPAEQLLEQLPNMVRMLEDVDGDGRFDRSTVFADKMTFPQGAAWFRGALYVASPPCIWRLEDTDGDGVADRREELVRKFGFIGNAADIHGCFLTPTGRIAWCDGRHGHEFKNAVGETSSKGLAARVFSCRPDGSDVEVFCGGGMDNPVEVAFTPEGDTIGTMTFYNPDDARHDALVHFVYGGVYPRKHPCTSEFKRTGDFLPPLSRFGVTAPSGLCRYAGSAWGEGYRDNFYSAQFNTHRIVRHVLSRKGATYEAQDEDFLVSTDPDFHPTDVLQDADGSLLVVDTGGWFRIGCPTSQVAKPEVGGGIYRIRRRGAERIADPYGLHIDWAKTSDIQMADMLADPRPAVVERAIEVLTQRGDAAMGSLATALFEATDFRARQHAVWALSRIGTENARLLLRQALADDDPLVRQAAVHAVSDLRDAESVFVLIEMLSHDEAAVRREAASALGRLRKATAVPALIAGLSQPADPFLEHALVYALIEIDDRQATLAGLTHQDAGVRRGALVALDQMDSGNLTRTMVAEQLATQDPALLKAAVDILSRHADWADDLSEKISAWLAAVDPAPDELAVTRGAVAALFARPAVGRAVARALEDDKTSRPTRLMLLEVIAEGEGDRAAGAVWLDGLRASLRDSDPDVLRQAIAAVSNGDVAPFVARLGEIGLDSRLAPSLRVAAWRALAAAEQPIPEIGFALLMAQWDDDASLRDRLAAAEALGTARLTALQHERVIGLLAKSGALELSWLLRSFERDANGELGLALVRALADAPALSSISSDRLRATFAHYPSEVQEAAHKLTERLAPDDRERAEKMQSIVASLDGGKAERGEELFFASRAACAACHRVGTKGERIGPDLSKIGAVRSRRDLVEAIVFPSASLARGYESFQAVLKDGRVHSGLLSRETTAAIHLRTTDRAEIRLERKDIDELLPIPTSIMPQGLDKTLSPAELRDLVAFLESLK